MTSLLMHEILSHWRGRKSPLAGIGCYLILQFLMGYTTQNDAGWAGVPALAFGWVALILSSLLALEAVWADDSSCGVLAQQRLGARPFGAIILYKTAAFYIAVVAPLVALFVAQHGFDAASVAALALGGLDVTLLLVMAGALTVTLRHGAWLAGLLAVLPLLVPPLTFGLGAQIAVLQNASPLPALALLGGVTLFTLITAPLATFHILSGQRA